MIKRLKNKLGISVEEIQNKLNLYCSRAFRGEQSPFSKLALTDNAVAVRDSERVHMACAFRDLEDSKDSKAIYESNNWPFLKVLSSSMPDVLKRIICKSFYQLQEKLPEGTQQDKETVRYILKVVFRTCNREILKDYLAFIGANHELDISEIFNQGSLDACFTSALEANNQDMINYCMDKSVTYFSANDFLVRKIKSGTSSGEALELDFLNLRFRELSDDKAVIEIFEARSQALKLFASSTKLLFHQYNSQENGGLDLDKRASLEQEIKA